MEFRVLGTLEVLDDAGHPVELRGAKLRTLLAALVLGAGQPVSVDRLVDVVWGDSAPRGAANALQAQVSKLRRLLADAPIETRDGGYVLTIDPDDIDAHRFADLATTGHRHLLAGRHSEAAVALRQALELWRGPALADFAFEEFAESHRTRLEESRLTTLEHRIDADLLCGRHEATSAELEGLVREHPLRERLWAQLMLALYRCDRQSDSLRAFQRARDVLIDELGLEPGPMLRELEQQILNHDAGIAAPASSPSDRPLLSNIHAELSTFVGRAADVASIVDLLGRRRMVTITGPGGVGKTRLATEVALRPDGAWPDGTWLVELGLESGERAVHSAMVRTFGPRLGSASRLDSIDWLTTGLAPTQLLIVFDNCEHVLAEAASVAATILRSCPGVTILATSREPLGLSGEAVRALDPLALDDAVELFASRAADSSSDFVLDDSSADAVATICTSIDRLPLAIELTAARTRAFSAHQLADLVRRRFGLVSTASSGRPARQQTMHAAMEWSFELLFDDERRLLSRLSVFSGGFTLDAAIAVCSDETLPADDVEVLLARLIDKSLVSTEGRSGETGRFRLLRPVAEFAAARCEAAGETPMMYARHTSWLIELTAGLTSGLRGPQRYEWAHVTNAELDNLVRSGKWGLTDGDPVQSMRIGVNLGWYAFLSANVRGDDRIMVRLLDRAPDAPAALRCRALMWGGLLSIGAGARRTWALDAVDVARTAAHAGAPAPVIEIDGTELTADAIAAARAIGDPALLLETLTIGTLHLAAIGSHPDVLRAMNEEARALAEHMNDRWSAAFVGGLEGLAAYVAGELDTSIALLRTAIADLQGLEDIGSAALFQVSLSEVAELRGDIPTATTAMAAALAVGSRGNFQASNVLHAVLCWLCGRNGEVQRALALGAEAVELSRRPFNPVIRAQALFALGAAEVLAGDHQAASEHLLEALAIHRQVGMKRETAMDHRHIGHLHYQLGDNTSALQHLGRAVELAVEVGLPWTVILTARWYAEVVVHDDPRLACVLLGNTESVSEVFGYVPTPDEQQVVTSTLATATELIGADAVAEALDHGSRMEFNALPTLLPVERPGSTPR